MLSWRRRPRCGARRRCGVGDRRCDCRRRRQEATPDGAGVPVTRVGTPEPRRPSSGVWCVRGSTPDPASPSRPASPSGSGSRRRWRTTTSDCSDDIRDLGLVTVCEEAGCPNIYECWADGTATFMINGSRCTRACGFCLVDTRHPLPLDDGEPGRVADAVARMRLAHAVITCVARDDLADGGAGAFAETIAAIREASPGTAVEVLISDVKGDRASLDHPGCPARRPEPQHRDRGQAAAGRPPLGGLRPQPDRAGPVGRGRAHHQVGDHPGHGGAGGRSARHVGRPARGRRRHRDPRPVPPTERPAPSGGPVVDARGVRVLRVAGVALGFAHVQASPLTRSSYHARRGGGCLDRRVGPVPVAVPSGAR